MYNFTSNEVLILQGINLFFMLLMFLFFVWLLKKQSHKKKKALGLVLLINYALIPAFILLSQKDLITDDELIRHFKKYEHEITTLMEEYRNNPDEWGAFEKASPQLKAMQKKAAVSRLRYKSISWHKEPYSIEAAKKFDNEITSGRNLFYEKQTIDVYVGLALDGVRVRRRGKSAYKSLTYIPVVPKIEQGTLWFPVNPGRPNYKWGIPIENSLNEVPDWMKPGDCAAKPISSQWFITLCQSYN